MNVVLLTGRLTRDPELRNLANGRAVTQFGVATNEYVRSEEKSEYHNVVTWGKLAEICGQYLTKGQSVAIEGRLQTRSWDDDKGQRHWKTEVNASRVEMLGGRRKKDYDAESAAHNLEQQAAAMGLVDDDEPEADQPRVPAEDPIPEGDEAAA
jgi:single-strand DNA-binding protein